MHLIRCFLFYFSVRSLQSFEYLGRNLIATLVAADVGNIVLGGPYHGTRCQETGYEITLVPVALTVIIASADDVALVRIVLDSERTGDMATIHTVKLLIHLESLVLAVENDVAVCALSKRFTVPLSQLPCAMKIGSSNLQRRLLRFIIIAAAGCKAAGKQSNHQEGEEFFQIFHCLGIFFFFTFFLFYLFTFTTTCIVLSDGRASKPSRITGKVKDSGIVAGILSAMMVMTRSASSPGSITSGSVVRRA